MSAAQARLNPLAPLYDFIRGHLLIVNNLVVGSGTLVGVLDFLAPRLSVLPKIIYSATAGVALLMLVAGIAPVAVERALAALGRAAGKAGAVPLWRRPAWQFATALLIVVSAVGFATVAKAEQGGVIASQFPAVRSLQESLLSLNQNVAQVKAGVDEANGKLDRIVDAVDPDNVADKCADIPCAIQDGASPKAVARLFAKGAKVPGNALEAGALLDAVAISDKPGRLEVIGMLYDHGMSPDLKFQPRVEDAKQLTPQGVKVAAELLAAARWSESPFAKIPKQYRMSSGDKDVDAWNDFADCALRDSGGVSPMELAAIRGDKELWAYLEGRGAKLPARPLICKWSTGSRGHGGVRVLISGGAASVLALD